jgi:hypothetical protein
VSFSVERNEQTFQHSVAFVIPVLPVVAARRDDRERHQTLFVSSLPDSVTNDARGRLTLSWGRSWGVTAWRLAFAFAAAMTARASAGGSCTFPIIHGLTLSFCRAVGYCLSILN